MSLLETARSGLMIIKNGNIVTSTGILEKTDVVIDGNRIAVPGAAAESDAVIDATDLYVCPGFVDIHTHGGGGGDFMDAETDAFDNAIAFHSQSGTTSLVATSVTAPVEQITDMLSLVRKYKDTPSLPCRILGAHIEGPYISLKHKGAQPEQFLRMPARDSYDFILENKDCIKTVTIAPELDGAVEMTAALTKAGIVVCGGHDDGDKPHIMPVIEAGLSHCTHLWCTMSTVSMRDGVRNVGLCELGLIDDRLTVEIIADNHHITPDMVKLICKCKSADKLCIVSDCLRAGGMPIGDTLYILGRKQDAKAQKFLVSDGVARLPDGSRLAGSIQPLSQMVRNLVRDAGVPLHDAVTMASLTPAKIIGEDRQIGSVEAGKLADICLLDRDFTVKMTITGGKIVYNALQ